MTNHKKYIYINIVLYIVNPLWFIFIYYLDTKIIESNFVFV